MSKTFLFPITIEVVGHQLVKREWNLFVSEGSLNFLGVGTSISSMETDPFSTGSLNTPGETFAGAGNDSSGQHPQYPRYHRGLFVFYRDNPIYNCTLAAVLQVTEYFRLDARTF